MKSAIFVSCLLSLVSSLAFAQSNLLLNFPKSALPQGSQKSSSIFLPSFLSMLDILPAAVRFNGQKPWANFRGSAPVNSNKRIEALVFMSPKSFFQKNGGNTFVLLSRLIGLSPKDINYMSIFCKKLVSEGPFAQQVSFQVPDDTTKDCFAAYEMKGETVKTPFHLPRKSG